MRLPARPASFYEMTENSVPQDAMVTLRQLSEWGVSGIGLHPGGSNYVFVVKLEDPERPETPETEKEDPEGAIYGIYKPSSGERPLRDFPYGTLHSRERAAYMLATELGWPFP